MEKNDYTTLKAENDRLLQEVEKLKQRLREEITRTQAGVRLDLNLEKGRIRDEAGQQELRIKEVDTRIESEIAGLRTQIETAKSNIFQFLFGLATGGGALLVSVGDGEVRNKLMCLACVLPFVQIVRRVVYAYNSSVRVHGHRTGSRLVVLRVRAQVQLKDRMRVIPPLVLFSVYRLRRRQVLHLWLVF